MSAPTKKYQYPGDDRISKRKRRNPDTKNGGWGWIAHWVYGLDAHHLKTGKSKFVWSSVVADATKEFQKKKGLPEDGIPGRKTWAAMFGPGSVTKYPHLILAPGAKWPVGPEGEKLLSRVDACAAERGLSIKIISGLRDQHQQHDLFMGYRRGLPGYNLAASCGNWNIHDWPHCPQQCMSAHCQSRAVDCGFITPSGAYVSFFNLPGAYDLAKKHGVYRAVPSEAWHLQCV